MSTKVPRGTRKVMILRTGQHGVASVAVSHRAHTSAVTVTASVSNLGRNTISSNFWPLGPAALIVMVANATNNSNSKMPPAPEPDPGHHGVTIHVPVRTKETTFAPSDIHSSSRWRALQKIDQCIRVRVRQPPKFGYHKLPSGSRFLALSQQQEQSVRARSKELFVDVHDILSLQSE